MAISRVIICQTHNRMRILFLLLVCLASGCAGTTSVLETYETEDLVVVEHNAYNNYMLMVYKDPLGQTRQVLRRNGVTEMVVQYTIDGNITVKARGKKERQIEVVEAGHITQRINSLLQAKSSEQRGLASI